MCPCSGTMCSLGVCSEHTQLDHSNKCPPGGDAGARGKSSRVPGLCPGELGCDGGSDTRTMLVQN